MALKKKYIKKAKGDFKKAWRLQRSAKRGRKKKRRVKSNRKKTNKQVKRKMGKNSVLDLGGVKVYKSDVFQTIGAGASGVLGGLVTQATGGKLQGNAAQVAAGLGLGFIGGRRASNIGKGVLMKGAADLIEDNVIPQILGGMGGSSSQNATVQTVEANMPDSNW